MQHLEHFIERFIFASRWLLAPFYLGLVGAIALLLFKFVKEFINLLPIVLTGEGTQVMVGVLTLVDVALVANLLLIIIFAGYKNFVSKINTGDHEGRPDRMGHVSFSESQNQSNRLHRRYLGD